jgi:hypothetical protein
VRNNPGSAAVRRPIRHQPPRDVAWQQFTARRAEVLAALDEDDRLIIESKRSPSFVQFAAEGRFGMHLEAVGNYYRLKKWRLDENQLDRMASLVWERPNVDEPSPEWIESDPDFVPNFHLDAAAPVPFRRVAALAVATLRDVYRIPPSRHAGVLGLRAGCTDQAAHPRIATAPPEVIG